MQNGQVNNLNSQQNSQPRGRHSFYVYERPHARQAPAGQQKVQVSQTTHDPGFNPGPASGPLGGPLQPPPPAPQPPSFANRNMQSRFNMQPHQPANASQQSGYQPFAAAPSEPIKPKPKAVFKKPSPEPVKPVWEVPLQKELELENKPLNQQQIAKSRVNLLGGKLKKPTQPANNFSQTAQAQPQRLTAADPGQQVHQQVTLPEPAPEFDPRAYHPEAQQTHSVSLAAIAPAQPASPAQFEDLFSRNANTSRKMSLRRILPKSALVMGSLIIIAGVTFSLNAFRTKQADQQEISSVSTSEQENGVLGIIDTAPSEDPPPATVGSFAHDEPKNISISSINVDAMVVEVGKSSNNRVKAPGNIYQLGWFNESAKPGQEGAVVLNGHVEGPTKHGALYSVSKIKSGDKLVLQTGNGGKFTYTVQAVEKFENDNIDMSKMLTPYTYGRKGLNIMTVGGRFNSKTNQYELRYAIYATQDN